LLEHKVTLLKQKLEILEEMKRAKVASPEVPPTVLETATSSISKYRSQVTKVFKTVASQTASAPLEEQLIVKPSTEHVSILDYYMMPTKTYTLNDNSFNQLIVTILSDTSLTITSLSGTELYHDSLPEQPVSFLSQEESSFCLLTRSGKILVYKFKLVENKGTY